MRAGKRSALHGHDRLLRPVIGLAENLPKKDLEHITVEAIRRHRHLRDEAEALHTPYVEQSIAVEDTVGSQRLAWVSAMIHMHTHQTLLSTLLDVLGYIPDVPGEKVGRQARSA
jgi:hypothetical protein